MTLADAKDAVWHMRGLPGAVLYVSPQDLDDLSDELWRANPLNKGPRPDTPPYVLATIYGVQIRKYGT